MPVQTFQYPGKKLEHRKREKMLKCSVMRTGENEIRVILWGYFKVEISTIFRKQHEKLPPG